MNTTVGDLAQFLEDNHILITVLGDKDAVVGVNGGSCDSRSVKPNDIFICKGAALSLSF